MRRCSKLLTKSLGALYFDPRYRCAVVMVDWHSAVGERLSKTYQPLSLRIDRDVAYCKLSGSSSAVAQFPYYKALIESKLISILKVKTINFNLKSGGYSNAETPNTGTNLRSSSNTSKQPNAIQNKHAAATFAKDYSNTTVGSALESLGALLLAR